jgi:hypothetical protein
MSIRRLSGTAGVAFVALVGIATLAQGAAGRPFGDPHEAGYLDDYLAYYTQADWIPMLMAIAVPLVWVSLAVFAVGAAVTLARGNWRDAGAGWALLGILGVTMQNAMFPVIVAMDMAQFRVVAEGAGMNRALHEAHEVLFTLNSASLAIALIGFSAAMRYGGVAPRWLSRVGLTSAFLLLASMPAIGFPGAAVALEGLGLVGFILWLVFIASTGVWLLRASDDVAAPVGEPSTQHA